MNRRSFLQTVGTAFAGLPFVSSLASLQNQARPPAPAPKRSYSATAFAMDLDGLFAGYLQNVEGGEPYADIAVNEVGPGAIPQKHVSNIGYSDIVLTLSPDMQPAMLKWLADFTSGKVTPKDGTISFLDQNFTTLSAIQFRNGIITELSFPDLDGSFKEHILLTIKISAEQIRAVASSGAKVSSSSRPAHVSTFKLSVAGIEKSCSSIAKIDAMSITCKIASDQVGIMREPTRRPAKFSFPDISITVPAATAGDLSAWVQDFLIGGNHLAVNEKTGLLQFFRPNQSTPFLEFQLTNVGIFKIGAADPLTPTDTVRRVKASLYCDQIKLGAAMARSD